MHNFSNKKHCKTHVIVTPGHQYQCDSVIEHYLINYTKGYIVASDLTLFLLQTITRNEDYKQLQINMRCGTLSFLSIHVDRNVEGNLGNSQVLRKVQLQQFQSEF